jgi:ABC-type multidrug transport system ATPase subunit
MGERERGNERDEDEGRGRTVDATGCGEAAVDVRELTKRYPGGALANDRLTLRIARGEVFGLLGPNGAGKTTLVLQVLGLLKPTSGTIAVEGVDVLAHPERVKRLYGYMPQARVAMRGMEVWRALYVTGRLSGLDAAAARRQGEALIERLGLGEHRGVFLERLSGGMTRVAAFAMALMGTPRLVVFDEPTNELDPVRRRAVWEVVRELGRGGDTTCLLVTHNVLEAEGAVDRVAIVDRGRVVALGTPGELKAGLGDEVRLEVVLKGEVAQNGGRAETEARLDVLGRRLDLSPGRYAVFLPRRGVGAAVDALLGGLGPLVDDFRVAPPSLEDVYIHHAGRTLAV